MENKHMDRVKASLAAWIHNRRRLEQLEEPGLIRGESKETRKRKRKGEIKEQVVGQWELDKDPPRRGGAGVDRWIGTEGAGRQTICRVRSVVWTPSCPERGREAAGDAADE